VIRDLIDVNVKVWMLTGDKLETAENIAFSCRLIQPDFQKIYLRGGKSDENEINEEQLFY
jgi:magnesium-transporting ATPase (P-type)